MTEILIATGNKGKFDEIMGILGDLPFEFLTLNDLGLESDAPENEITFQENAKKKAIYYFHKLGAQMPVIADDSGVIVDVLDGQLGVKTRRWGLGEKVSDQEWVDFFLKKMEEFPTSKRTARFISAAAICLQDGEVKVFEGRTEGVITKNLEAKIVEGLPLSSCFKPNGLNKVFSALSVEEKNLISHRGKAFKGLKNYLKDSIVNI